MVMSAEMLLMLLVINYKEYDIRIFRDCIRSDSEKGDIEKKQKITF